MPMPLRVLFYLLLLSFLLSACENSTPTDNSNKNLKPIITVQNAYIRAMPPGQSVTALFLEITNQSSDPIDLVKAETTASEHIELHEHKQLDGMMQMGQVKKITIPAKQSLALATGGYHIMLIGLKQDLAVGKVVDIKLIFNNDYSMMIHPLVKKD